MFATTGFPSGAKYGITQSCGGIFQQTFILTLMQGAWQVEKYWETSSTLPISKLKQKVDTLVLSTFEREGKMAIGDVFDMLMEQGFMPCNLYAFLTGFLLKEYSSDTYRYTDGEISEKMTSDKLGEIIGEYIKHKNIAIPRYKTKYIEVMTRNQMAFLSFARTVFIIPDNLSIEQTAVHIRSKLKEFGFPIWCYKKIDILGLSEFIDKIAAIANPDNTGEDIAKIAGTLGEMSFQIPTAVENLAVLLTKSNAERAMQEFLDIFESGDVLRFGNEIGAQNILLDAKKIFSQSEALWLWDQVTGEEEIRKLLIDYKIVFSSNKINTTKSNSLSACLDEWREKIKVIKIPCATLMTEIPSLKTLFSILREISINGELNYDKHKIFIKELIKNIDKFQDFFATRKKI
jgi:hypothetical protein